MQGVFLAEGLRLFEEMPRDRLAATFVSETFLNREKHRQLLDGIAYEEVSDAVFKHMCDTQTPQGILSIVRRPVYEWADLMQGGRTHLLILEGIQDPGNLGTMFRAAEGSGLRGFICSKDRALYNGQYLPHAVLQDRESGGNSQRIEAAAGHAVCRTFKCRKIL